MIVYLNGEFLPLEEAHVSVLDRGFLFGDGVYEVIPVYSGHLFRAQEHLHRLDNSLKSIKLQNPLTRSQWIHILDDIVTHNHGGDQAIYLQVTRGSAKRDHNFPEHIVPTVFVMSDPIEVLPPSKGVRAITTLDTRWQHCDIKSISLLSNILLRRQAIENGGVESILIREGYAMEGAASNVFIVDKGIVITPPKSTFILAGITRDLILEAMHASNISCCEANISESQLHAADEIWLTSSTREILPVITLDKHRVGTGKVGSVWAQVLHIYQQYKQTLHG
ncbi:MAG: D-amino acid aminotransferase [Thiomargarita sp.]|nr:D-amino acid aminotransferase [Thiomargarita sp.]